MTTATVARLTEKAFAQQVVDLATIFRWRVYRTWISVRSPKGFPDLVLVRSDRLVFAELKSAVGRTSPEQDAWLEDLRAAAARQDRCGLPEHLGFEVYLWRPADLNAIARVLGGPSGGARATPGGGALGAGEAGERRTVMS